MKINVAKEFSVINFRLVCATKSIENKKFLKIHLLDINLILMIL